MERLVYDSFHPSNELIQYLITYNEERNGSKILTDGQRLWLFVNRRLDTLDKEERMCQKCIDECHDENRCIRCGEPIEDKNFWKSDTSDEEWYEKAYGENWRSIVYGERKLREDELDNLNVDAFLERKEMFREEDNLQLFDEDGNEIVLDTNDEEPNIELIENEQYEETDDGNAYEEFDYYENDENYENVEPNGFDDM